MKKNILFCIGSHISLFKKTSFHEIGLGPALVRGALDEDAYDIDYFDLDIFVNEKRGTGPLFTPEDIYTLLNTQVSVSFAGLRPYYDHSRINDVLDMVLEGIPRKRYDYILFSIPKATQGIVINMAVLNFTFLLARRLKKISQAPVIMGGYVFRFIPEGILRKQVTDHLNSDFVDFIFLKEDGCLRLPRLLKALESPFSLTTNIADVTYTRKRIYYKSKNIYETLKPRVVDFMELTPLRAALKTYSRIKKNRDCKNARATGKLDIVPRFDTVNAAYSKDVEKTLRIRDFLPKESHKFTDGKGRFAVYPLRFASGCVNNCNFCAYSQTSFETLPPVRAVDMIEKVIVSCPGAKYFNFINCQINFSQKYAMQFCREIIKRGLDIKFSDSAHVRNPSNELFEALRKAGCVKLWLGLESISPRILKTLNKHLTVDDIYKGIDIIDSQGIWIGANLITGLPFETALDHECNLKFIRESSGKINAWDINIFEFYYPMPFYQLRSEYGLKAMQKYHLRDRLTAFEEIGLRTGEEREKEVLRMYDELLGAIPAANDFLANDRLFFYFYDRLSLGKEKTYQLICEYYEALRKNKSAFEALWNVSGFDYDLYRKKGT